MAKHTNYSEGMRGVTMKDGSTLWANPGETIEFDDANAMALPDFGSPPNGDDTAITDLAAARAEIADLRAKLAAATGAKKPGLTGKNKDQLLAIAADEGVTIEDGATVNDIISAIELHREVSAAS